MKAVVVREFGAPGLARIEEVALPAPGPTEVLLRVEVVPANYVDTVVLAGRYQFLPERPFIPGKGPAGTVIAVGEAATRFNVGDRILAMVETGGYAEAVCVDEEQCYALPDSLSFDAAASISLAFDTAWFALHERGRLKAGDAVLVLGATGAVGNASVQLAKAAGAKVIAAVSSPSKSGSVVAVGADHVIDLSVPDLRNGLREQVYAVTGGNGVDVVVDPLGGDIFDAAIRAVAWRGRVVIVGFAAGRIPTLSTNYLMLKNIEVSGLQISDYRKRTPDLVRKCFEDVFDLHVRGVIKEGPSQAYPLKDYARALDDLLGRRVSGRALLKPGS
ncbi:NADPH:quinone oxidoreductase family protein [Aquamicrobium sp.]|uniref:NADPH:quinone oxidoreductase family protein n=1 Tax=Aquamicrobium sp. TaxID=1872579 RepID=UPI00258AB1D3|nr:NADPH:quinone oxidoreductase family protein [Aquamicrobium sp.]MCK9552654.1 NADPH:quinone oxidoreductase family protein [Aquamicrobium sp.]